MRLRRRWLRIARETPAQRLFRRALTPRQVSHRLDVDRQHDRLHRGLFPEDDSSAWAASASPTAVRKGAEASRSRTPRCTRRSARPHIRTSARVRTSDVPSRHPRQPYRPARPRRVRRRPAGGAVRRPNSIRPEGRSQVLDRDHAPARRVLRRRPGDLRPAARTAWDRVPARLLARARIDPVRPDGELRRAGTQARARKRARLVRSAPPTGRTHFRSSCLATG